MNGGEEEEEDCRAANPEFCWHFKRSIARCDLSKARELDGPRWQNGLGLKLIFNPDIENPLHYL